jgi:hypothetical protein
MNKCLSIVLLAVLGACNGDLTVRQRTAELSAPACSHGACTTGDVLSPTCDACAAAVCQHDAYCCTTTWDAICVGEADQFCAGVCQTSCSVGTVPIVKLADWDGQLPAPKGREVLVLGPWTDDAQMSASVFQEQTNQLELTIVFDSRDLARFFTVAVTPYDIIIVGSAPGIGPQPRPGNPTGTGDELLAAIQALARATLGIEMTPCTLEGARGPVPEPAIPYTI